MKGKVIAVLLMELTYEKYSKLIDSFFDLDPTNPQVCQDLIGIFSDYKKIPDLLDIFNKKKLEYAHECNSWVTYTTPPPAVTTITDFETSITGSAPPTTPPPPPPSETRIGVC